ncbi:outer membrane beta-barrel family protein [Leeuwenhoekiella sp. ZYFB001]|uniref:outer membrane beta-barrel family protein n=1 Tax=Leeuwenhoekiella sp. ZYFB001 TaxID=2719912 RepID=UPI0014314931|nr:outer membrane beta-barrel family protein [Leeuwenhoekiella sp. ZYFB001]
MQFNYKILLIGIALFLSAQTIGLAQETTLSGIVTDESSGQPIPYATVLVKNKTTAAVITGSTTSDDGNFKITYEDQPAVLEISFVGFQTKLINDVPTGGTHDLGTIVLGMSTESLDEVVVTAETSTMEFKLDRRVFNVGQDLSSAGMGALDVLSNVPSVNVDIEGAISLRGSSGVQILIDGKPSVLADESSNALGTITADMIESIEVITNPSAKYEAEGTSGIINIILKKEEKRGFNGSASVNTGVPNNHSLGLSLNNRSEKFNLFTQLGAGHRTLPMESNSVNRNLESGTSVITDGGEDKNETFFNLTLGADYYINDKNIVTLSGNYAFEKEDSPSDYLISSLDASGDLVSQYNRVGETSADNPKYQFDLQYKSQFGDDEDHTLLASATGNFFGKDQSSTFINNLVAGESIDPNQKTETDFYQSDYTFKVDYTNPLSERITLEAGSMYEINDVGNDYAVYTEEDGAFIIDTDLTNNFEFNQKVLGLYATAAYEGDRWGLKAGLRFEDTGLTTLLTNTNEQNNQAYNNWFPSVHTSYKVSDRVSLQAGYSKRIFRPRLWDLNPFFTIQNVYNVRQGNPFLQPEFADSYELTSIIGVGKLSLNSSLYFLHTTDVVETVSVFEDNVNISTPQNIGTRDQYGFELNGKYSGLSFMTLTGDFNYGYFIREGTFEDQNFDFSGNQWTARMTTKFDLPADIDLELNGNYESKYKTVQGEISGFAFLDAGLRKKIWDGKMVVNASVRDVFASRIRENTINQQTFSLYDFSKRGRFFTLGVSYSFGKGEAMTYSGGKR